MTISEDKTRFLVTMLKKDKEKLEAIAKKENRSLNNLIETTLKRIIEED